MEEEQELSTERDYIAFVVELGMRQHHFVAAKRDGQAGQIGHVRV